MPVTPVFGFPFPALTDPPDGPDQIGDLALAVENGLIAQLVAVQTSIATLANPPRAQLRQIVSQNVAINTWTPITFTAEDHDSHNGHDNATNPSRYTAQVNGLYEFAGSSWWAADSNGVRLSRWHKNGATVTGSGLEFDAVANSGGQTAYPSKTVQIALLVGDYVELAIFQNAVNPLATFTAASEAQSTMTVKLVRNDNF